MAQQPNISAKTPKKPNPATAGRTAAGSDELNQGARTALFAMGEIAVLALLKGVVGYSTGIVVLMADALSSFSDMLGVFASYIGLKMSRRRADKKFKYGYYKAESFAAFLASVLIIYLGIEVFVDSFNRLFELEVAHDHILALAQVAVSILLSLHLAYYLIRTGKRINSLSLINSGKEKKSDLISQIAVVAGIAASFFHIPYLEGIIGMILSGLILKVGAESGKESLFFLLDYFDDQDLMNKIEKIFHTKSRIVGKIVNIRMRRAGTYIFGEAFVEINPYVEAKDIRNDLKNLKERIMKLDRHFKEFSIFFEVPLTREVRVAVPVQNNDGLHSRIATTFEETRYYIFVDVVEGKITGFNAKPFEFKTFQFVEMAEYLKNDKVNIVINNNMHSLLFYNLRRLHHILIYPHFNNVSDVENTIKLLVIDT